jgi:1-acyl-sn-glycerol-3-phosphate acyltransferase
VNTVASVVAAILFAISTIVCSILSVPLSLMDRSGRLYLVIGRFWARSFLVLFGIHVTVTGRENIRRGQNYVYLANHSSHVDIPVVMAAIPDQIRIILKKSLTRIPIWGWALKASPFITIDRSNPAAATESLAEAVRKIRAGASILLFPEGTRTSDGKLQPFKRGAFRLAFDSKTPMLPVAITGTYDILSRGSGILPRFGGRVHVRIGEVIDPEAFTARLSESDAGVSSSGLPAAPPNARALEIAMMKEAEARVRTMLEAN